VGVSTSFVVRCEGGDVGAILSDRPANDADGAERLVRRLYPGRSVTRDSGGNLMRSANPQPGLVFVGCFPELDIVCTADASIAWVEAHGDVLFGADADTYLHSMNSVMDWCSIAIWQEGALMRAVSLAPDQGILDNTGARLPFEGPYWAGEHPVEFDPAFDEQEYPLPFYPLEFGDDALNYMFGFSYDRPFDLVNPSEVQLVGYILA